MAHPPQEAVDLLAKYSKELRYLSKRSGKKMSTVAEASFLFDALQCEAQYNLTQPGWAKEIRPEVMEEIMEMHLRLFTWTEAMKRGKAGPLLTEIVDHMHGAMEHRKMANVFVYAGHDFTLSTVSRTLGVDQQLPKLMALASALVFELHLEADVPMVKVRVGLLNIV